jgi:hypothetical protein
VRQRRRFPCGAEATAWILLANQTLKVRNGRAERNLRRQLTVLEREVGVSAPGGRLSRNDSGFHSVMRGYQPLAGRTGRPPQGRK